MFLGCVFLGGGGGGHGGDGLFLFRGGGGGIVELVWYADSFGRICRRAACSSRSLWLTPRLSMSCSICVLLPA